MKKKTYKILPTVKLPTAILPAIVTLTTWLGVLLTLTIPTPARCEDGLDGFSNAEQTAEIPDDDFEAESEEPEVWDPIEPVNRGIFWFNDKLDIYILEPLAIGYDAVVPDSAQGGIRNFFRNISYPGYLVSDLIALDFDNATTHTGRFLINSTVGILGVLEVADDMGLKHQETDLGAAFGKHGVGEGPYIVLPIFGPSNARDAIGRVGDTFLDTLTLLAYTEMSDDAKVWLLTGGNMLRIVNRRAALLNTIDSAKEGSVDYYGFVRSAYAQNRRGLIDQLNGKSPKDANFDEEDDSEDFLPE